MRISYNWLKELLPDLTATPEEIAEVLTMHSFETQVLEQWRIDEKVTVVKITKIEPHPNADRLRLATVDLGKPFDFAQGKQEIRVVCGAPNIQEGQTVPYSPPSTAVIGQDGKPFMVTEAKIRGQMSPGMLNSARELGLGKDHSGIFILPADTPLGTKLIDHVPNDVILEADVTPNRAHDCLGHVGIARELAALLKLAVTEPEGAALPEPQTEVEDFRLITFTDEVSRYMGVVLKDATNTSNSPLWMQARLIAMGAKPISALVDITNYILFETGQPSHAFDSRKLPGKGIGVREGREGDWLRLLDEKEIKPSGKDLVITSNDTPVALAGVMGASGTEVDADTTDIFFEIASFHSFPIQETARRWNLRTESALRFAKGLTPDLVEAAARRLTYLATHYTGARILGRLDYYPRPAGSRVTALRPERASAVAGTEIDRDEMKEVFGRLRCAVDDTNSPWNVTVPLDRLDITDEHDLVEEVIRIVGLENIPAQPLDTAATPPRSLPDAIYWREAVRDLLVQLGLTETYNYSFEPADTAQLVDSDSADRLTITNPIAPELAHLRASLLPGLLHNAATNRDDWHKKFSTQEKALFEIGKVFRQGEGGQVPGVIEELHVAGILVGAKDMAENIVDEIRRLLEAEGMEPVYLDDLGSAVLKKLKYRVPLAAFEVNLTPILKGLLVSAPRATKTLDDVTQQDVESVQYTQFSRYPSVLRDISLLVEAGVSVEKVQEVIERVGGELVVDTDPFDEYEPRGTGKKGLAFHIEYEAPDRTLTDEEVNVIQAKIIVALESELSAEIR